MRFDSLEYAALLAATVLLFFRLGPRARLILLAGASLFFYAVWDVPLTSLILVSAVVDYTAGRAIERTDARGRKRLFLAASMVTNLGLLGYFKYANFFIDNVQAITGTELGGALEVVLPPGISFYTFQTMSYTIDVYRGRIPAARSWWRFLVYVSFFPQLVAGPIERAGRILPQIQTAVSSRFVTANLVVASRLILWGLFKKTVIADHCGDVADTVYGDPESATLWAWWVATYAFTLQIYCDFSAYSEIARGSARLFGIRLMRNFDQPYLVGTPRDFWRRWHISLSEWFRDYVYRALGGNRRGRTRTLVNLTATMFLSGLWHGAAWNFVVWGLFHGVLLVGHQLGSRTAAVQRAWASLGRGAGVMSWFITFHLVVFGWVLFRIESFSDLGTLASGAWSSIAEHPLPTGTEAAFLLGTYGFVVLSALARRRGWFDRLHSDLTAMALFYGVVAVLIAMFAAPEGHAFIYFQF